MTVRPNIASPGEPTTVENADVTVVGGAGHVGVPLVLALAEAGMRVNVNDLNQKSLATLQGGQLPFIEQGADGVLGQALANRRLVFTDSSDRISTGGPVIVTIGTPIDEFLNPVRKVVQDCIDALLPALADGQLLVLRSTAFPGHHRLAGGLFASSRPRAEGGLLSGAHRSGARAEGTARDAADYQRHQH